MTSIQKFPQFTQSELQAMHRYCLEYKAFYDSGRYPTKEQDDKFMAFQKVCYGEGVARGR